MRRHLTHARLLELLRYDAESGEFFWKDKAGARRVRGRYVEGTRAGSLSAKQGRFYVGVEYSTYLRSRLAWYYVHGSWPNGEIDHINCDKSDDRIANLREATRAQQQANVPRGRSNTSGHKGVTWHGRREKWQAQIRHNGKYRYLGVFADRESAAMAYRNAAREAFGEFARIA